jgi:ribosome-binding protein aMBF1 (putative translation factor)
MAVAAGRQPSDSGRNGGRKVSSVTRPRARARSLHAWREAQGLSQADAASRFGLSQAHWSRLERGLQYPGPMLATRLHAATGVPLGTLLKINGTRLVDHDGPLLGT